MIKIKKISDFADVITGGTPSTSVPEYWDGDIPWINSGCLNDGRIKEPTKYITKLGLKKSSAKILPKDTVLVALTGSTTGQVGYLSFEATANQSVTGILPSKEHFSLYLYYYLKSQRKKIRNAAFGGAQPHINQKYVKEFKVPLPKLEDQERIAYLLSKIESLILQRKQSLLQLDELTKSIFVKLFGDPIKNDKKWNKKQLKVFGKIFTGNTPSRRDSSNYDNNHIEWIKTNNIQNDSFYISKAKEYLSKNGRIKGRTVSEGALLVACIAGSMESIGRAALTNRDVAFNQQINAIQPNKDIDSLFLYVLFKICRKYIQTFATNGMKNILSKGDFEKIEMIYPPVDLQKKYANIIERIIKIQEQNKVSLTNLENLYNSLSEKAFKGELDLTKVPIAIKIDLEAEGEQQVRFPESVEKFIELQDKIMPKGIKPLYDPNSVVNIANRVSKFTDIPDYSSWQQSTAFDEEYEELENDYKQLNEQDIRQIFDHSKKALSFKELLDKLDKKTTLDLRHYEFIKTVLYNMLANNELEQIKVDINRFKKDNPPEFILKFKRVVA